MVVAVAVCQSVCTSFVCLAVCQESVCQPDKSTAAKWVVDRNHHEHLALLRQPKDDDGFEINTTHISNMAEPSASSDTLLADGGDSSNATGAVHSISKASYPIPQSLSRVLKAAILGSGSENDRSTQQHPSVLLESPTQALQHLVENALSAIDLMYFSTPAKIRQDSTCIQHRLCLRVATNSEDKTLTITDLGIGMTRADLINMLGVGRAGHSNNPAGHRQKRRVSSSTNSTSGTATSDDDDDEGDEEEDDDDDTQDDDDDLDEDVDEEEDEEEDEVDDSNGPVRQVSAADKDSVLSCKKNDIGGFYSALCTLGRGVKVGTKVRNFMVRLLYWKLEHDDEPDNSPL